MPKEKGSRRSGSRIGLDLDEQIQVGIHRIADVGRYTAEVDAFDDFFFFDAHDVHGHGAGDHFDAHFCAWAIMTGNGSTFFCFMTAWIIFEPMPPMFIFEIGSWPAWFGSMMSNIFSMPRLATLTFSGRLMTFKPQKVKNIVTCLP